MTREEVVQYWEQFDAEIDDIYDTASEEERAVLEEQRKMVEFTISALRQQETVTNRNGLNEPLTLDELRKMSGDPVFVVTDRMKEWCIVHSHHSDDVIGGGIIMTRRTAEKRTYQYKSYGYTWIAYRQKPAENFGQECCPDQMEAEDA